jgi:hypothetical protein
LGLPLIIGFVTYRQWRKRRPPTAKTPVPNET